MPVSPEGWVAPACQVASVFDTHEEVGIGASN